MKTARLQAAFARKREAEHIRNERTQETNRYFDHWGKVTSRFQSWTTPEYYENAEKSLKEQKEKQFKEEKLNGRREILRKLLDTENQQYENELQAIILRKQSPSVLLSGRRRSKYDEIDVNILEKIKENRSDEMRRLELEAKLYKKWRNPVTGVTLSTTPLAIVGATNEYSEDKSIFESKSDNEVMAKLNWLDKQIENQMRREEEDKEMQKHNLRLQEEARKREEIQRERHLIRESEIKELRALQENHVKALKQRELESIQLQQDEEHYRHILETIEKELNYLKLNQKDYLKIIETNLPHNIKRIKIVFKQLSDEYNERFQKDIECLKRIKLLLSNVEHDNNNMTYENNTTVSDQIRLTTIQQLIEKLENQYKNENLNQSDICNMYESEAKINFNKWKELSYNEEILRRTKIIELLEHDQIYYETKLTENLKQQKIIIEIRETHLSAIENSNEKLRMSINVNGATAEAAATGAISYDDNFKNGGNIGHSSNKKNSNLLNQIGSNSRNASRCSSRISNIHDLNSYREESANSFKHTKSRIFGWIDEENDDNLPHSSEKKHFNKKKTNLLNTIPTDDTINTDDLKRAELISDLRKKISHETVVNHQSDRRGIIKSFGSNGNEVSTSAGETSYPGINVLNSNNFLHNEFVESEENLPHLSEKRHFNKKKTNLLNTIPSDNTINSDDRKRSELISDLRKKISHETVANHRSDRKSITKSFGNNNNEFSTTTTTTTDGTSYPGIDALHSNNFLHNEFVEEIDKNLQNECNITDENSSNSNNLRPKFGKKRVAWT